MEEQILQVPIEDILPNRFQPRLAFDDASLQDLAASIKQHGIIQPLILRRKNDKYEIIAGERRYKAARMAGLVSVPAIISNLSDAASAEVAIVENVQRKDLTAIEEAKSYQAILDKGYMTQEELAKKMGLSQSAISNKLRLLTLDESVQNAVLKNQISERHARSLLKVKDKNMQKVLLDKIINERLTVRQLEEEIKKVEPTLYSEDININASTPTTNVNQASQEPIASVGLNQPQNATPNLTTVSQVAPTNNEPTPTNTMETQNINATSNNSDDDDVPLVKSVPNIEDILKNAVDIKSQPSEVESMNNNASSGPVNTANLFNSSPEKAPNRFFNFLEATAANLDFDEPAQTFELPSEPVEPKQDPINQTDNIEMLDDFVIPVETKPDTTIMNNAYLDSVIKTIRGLNFDSDKVTIEEINLPTEYHITIKIKKDKI
ncbi:MAG TPA: ParB/RepB/Spo0J family partition protein [Candidatus Onthocola stercorigallinarum]|nr:ParB/RepB/Spo0J family partition protein [Candidatus Onthocola stercorigallinarum]